MKTSRAVVSIGVPAPKAPRRPRSKAAADGPVVAKIAVLNPWANGALRSAVALGATLAVEFDGYGLVIRAQRKGDTR